MAYRQKVIKLDDGISRIEGYNVGKYPWHHFVSPKDSSDIDTGPPLRLLSTGEDEWVAGCYRKRLNSRILALEFVMQGTFRFTLNGEVFIAYPGDLFLVLPGCDIEMSLYKCQYGVKKVMQISGPLVNTLLNITGLERCCFLHPNDKEWLVKQFERCYELCKKPPANSRRIISSVIYEVLLELSHSLKHKDYPENLRRIIMYMEDNIGYNLKIRDLCAIANVSQASLFRLFRKYLRTSPFKYFNEIKIKTAKNMLLTTPLSIKEIASHLGYSSQLYFSSEFKKYVGFSPKIFREKNRKIG